MKQHQHNNYISSFPFSMSATLSYIKNSILIFLVLSMFAWVSAETVVGGGYTVEQVITPFSGSVSGNGYTVDQASQPNGDAMIGGGYIVDAVFGTSTASTSSGGGGVGGGTTYGGGGWYYFPPVATSTQVSSSTQIASTTLPIISLPIGTGGTCNSRIVFSAPIDVGASTNNKDDVKKLEYFLNTYENENLPINGIYETRDVQAVKRWQAKYRSFILDPMHLKSPTGTVYTLSQRQIERQSTKTCGQKIVVNVCPYFDTYTKYGDRGENVKKVQQFLNIVRGERLNINGVYGPLTKEATKRFQRAYKKDILSIIQLSFISGNWNAKTRLKANTFLGCR
jgi:peptidoglycan hydrolase-like protein with peptidoglycan-binding domain